MVAVRHIIIVHKHLLGAYYVQVIIFNHHQEAERYKTMFLLLHVQKKKKKAKLPMVVFTLDPLSAIEKRTLRSWNEREIISSWPLQGR